MALANIVIPLHKSGGYKGTNLELKYVLRSLERHFKDDFTITIVGPRIPEWMTGVKLIKTNGGLKTALRLAAEEYPEGFHWWYDDVILLRDATASELKISFGKKGLKGGSTGWSKGLSIIAERLKKEGIEPWDFSHPHGPYWFDKGMVDEGFEDWPGMAGKFPWESWILSKRKWPTEKRSYRQYYGEFTSEPSGDCWYMNFNSKGFSSKLIEWLEKRFPKQSGVEKQRIEVVNSPRNAISFSLFGDQAIYSAGLCFNLEAAKTHYPDWEVVVHAESGHPSINRLKSLGAIVIERQHSEGERGRFWRFDTGAMTGRYDRVIFRDADSRLNQREKAAVDDWIASGKSLHVMRDHKDHHVPICAGMFGIKTEAFDLLREIERWPQNGHYRDDEKFLSARLWPALKHDALIHSGEIGATPFPNHPPMNGHVGEVVTPSFDPTKTKLVLISPEKYEERRAKFLESLKTNGGFLNDLKLEWFRATPHEETYFPPTFRKFAKRAHWWAATCDHTRVMELAIVGGYENILIFEDDVIFDKGFNEDFWRAWSCLPQDWRAMRMGWNSRFDNFEGGNPRVHNGILSRCNKHGQGMYSTLWNRAGLIRFYDHMWHRRNMTIDEAFEDLRRREPTGGWYQTWKQIAGVDPSAAQMGRDK